MTDKDKVFGDLADRLGITIQDAAHRRDADPPPCVQCQKRPTLRRDGLCDECAGAD